MIGSADLREGRQGAGPRLGRVGRHDDEVRVPHQLDGLERPTGDRDTVKETSVSPAHLVEQLLIGRRLGELHLDARALGHEAAHEVGQDPRADAHGGPDPERAGVARGQRLEVGPGGLHARHHPLGVAQEHLAGLRQGHARRGPPGRSIRRSPTARSSVAICCEMADWV